MLFYYNIFANPLQEFSMSPRNYSVQTQINKPVSVVFDAIVQPERLCKYFVDKTSGPLVEGKEIIWTWSQWGDYPVIVKKLVPNRLIELEANSTAWKKTTGPGYGVKMIMELAPLSDTSTMLTISETGWLHDEPGYKASHENCGGWTHMALCLKAYLEYGLDLRGLSPEVPKTAAQTTN